MVKAITSKQEWDDLMKSGEPFVVDFSAVWCGPCKMISPHFEKMEPNYPNIKFVKIDVDEVEEVSQEVGVRAMPTFMAFKDGSKVGDFVGASPAKLADLLKDFSAKLQ